MYLNRQWDGFPLGLELVVEFVINLLNFNAVVDYDSGGLEMSVIKSLRVAFPHTVVQRHYRLIAVGFATQKTTISTVSGILRLYAKAAI